MLVQYAFDGAAGNEESFAASFVAANMSALDISRGSGITGASGAGTFNSRSWPGLEFDGDAYVGLSLDVDAGFQYTLTSLSFDERRSGTGPTAWFLRSSADGFTTNLEFTGTSSTLTTQTVTFDDVFEALTGSTEFRFYGTESGSSLGTWRVDNIEFFGTVTPVPEPKSWVALVATALFGWTLFRRKR